MCSESDGVGKHDENPGEGFLYRHIPGVVATSQLACSYETYEDHLVKQMTHGDEDVALTGLHGFTHICQGSDGHAFGRKPL